MRVRNSRAALLTDYEVLTLVKELEAKLQDGAARAAAREAELERKGQLMTSSRGGLYDNQYTNEERHDQTALKTIPHNLRQIQYPLLEALGTTQRPCHHQNEGSIPAFLEAISLWERGKAIAGLEGRIAYDVIGKDRKLTKGERLMLINHAPSTMLDLHTIVEEIEQRFSSDEHQDLLAIIQLTLPLDSEALMQDNELTKSRLATQRANHFENVAEDLNMAEGGYEDEAIVEDLDEFENEGRGEGAVDDEAKEDM